jgi:hypothetical protein
LDQLQQDAALSTITLEAVPLNKSGVHKRDMYRFLQDRQQPIDAPPGQLQSVPIASMVTSGRQARLSIEEIVVNARPFDIYVEFGMGARVMQRFGSKSAKKISQDSPLTSNYEAYIAKKSSARRDNFMAFIAQARAAMQS